MNKNILVKPIRVRAIKRTGLGSANINAEKFGMYIRKIMMHKYLRLHKLNKNINTNDPDIFPT